jgi:hypothetical protein
MSAESAPVKRSLWAAGDSALGRGVHGPIPLHLIFETVNLSLQVQQSFKYRITLQPMRS